MVKDTTTPAIHPNDLLSAALAEFEPYLKVGMAPTEPEQLVPLLTAVLRHVGNTAHVTALGMKHEQGPTSFSAVISGLGRLAEAMADLPAG